MSEPDSARRVLLGVSGSIAAYKAAEICSQLGKMGLEVDVVLTKAAAQFVGPATFRALTRNPVLTGLFDEPHHRRIAHIDVAHNCSLALVAPASANVLARMCHGLADDMLTTCLLALPAGIPLLAAPAMNTQMWMHPATQSNLKTLRERDVEIIEPASGMLACLEEGTGKLAPVEEIVEAVRRRLQPVQSGRGIHVLITAGPTREPLDPVRFLSNRSSGKMGYALAAAAAHSGAQVTLVSGPVALPVPAGVECIRVETAEQMLHACRKVFAACHLLIACAAVSDYAPVEFHAQKIKRSGSGALTLTLRENPDIVAALAAGRKPDQYVVGFAAETEHLAQNAAAKLAAKRLDLIVANNVSQPDAGFETDTNRATLYWADGGQEALPLQSKQSMAEQILQRIHPRLQERLKKNE